MTTELHGYTIDTLPATQDARQVADYLVVAYPRWKLQAAGQLWGIMSARQQLERDIRHGDVEGICRQRVILRDAQHEVTNMFGGSQVEIIGSWSFI